MRLVEAFVVVIRPACVAKYMKRRRGPPSQTWKTFLKNQMADTAEIDFFVVSRTPGKERKEMWLSFFLLSPGFLASLAVFSDVP